MTFRFQKRYIARLLIVLTLSACQKTVEKTTSQTEPQQVPTQTISSMLPFGNPSGATTDTADKDNYIVVHDSFILSYNNSRGTMNWIAWRTTRADLGKHLDRHLFNPDPNLPDGFKRIQYYDYAGSGYDRGHMVPSADRFGNEKLNAETFNMTNIVPQASGLNQYPWNKFEMFARTLVFRGSELYTVAGVYGDKERLRGKVTVPTNCWKIVVVFPKGRNGEIVANTRVIAVDMPNNDDVESIPWERYKTTVRDIETKTGFDIFSSLPRDIQDVIENRLDGN